MIDGESEPGSYAKALRYPPYVGAMNPDGEFRRGFSDGSDGRPPQRAEGFAAADQSFHNDGDTRVGQ